MQAEKPADKHIIGESAGCAPDTYRKINKRRFLDLDLGAEERYRPFADRNLQGKKHQANEHGNDDGLAKGNAQPVIVICTEALCRDACCAHTQEIHPRVQEPEDGAADRNRTEVGRTVEVPGNTRVHHAK